MDDQLAGIALPDPLQQWFTRRLAPGAKVDDDETVYDKKIDFKVYTWGQADYPVNKNRKDVTVGEFLDYFYGYVSAKFS